MLNISMPRYFFTALFIAMLFVSSSKAQEANISIAGEFEKIYSTTVVLMDSDALSFGVGNFDPEEILRQNEDDTINDALNLRNQISVIAVPYTIDLGTDLETYEDYLNIQLAYIKQEAEVSLFEDIEPDFDKEQAYGLSVGYSRKWFLNKNWTLAPALSAYFIHYKNTHLYNSEETQAFQPQLDEILFNQKKNAILFEPGIELAYLKNNDWGAWEFTSEAYYMSGRTTSELADGSYARPEGWRIINGVKVKNTFKEAKLFANDFYFKAHRVDIRGDTVHTLGTQHYYKIGFGILWDIRNLTDLVENVGIGININHGSAISGGSIVLYINEW
ncbi:hypothetical protein E8M12_15315 [Thalassotalea mangrovi]|uniref:Solitary outer membrane autotransporter-like beta-barrel domain-containing protein n=2 Tax=Thalassotalea mangrovi TaxID=2572245 RepID=A0A4U1B1U7_9GAMM|nr:hypothetical protein E8M12_15315 [Thalassotalea mangrovi]